MGTLNALACSAPMRETMHVAGYDVTAQNSAAPEALELILEKKFEGSLRRQILAPARVLAIDRLQTGDGELLYLLHRQYSDFDREDAPRPAAYQITENSYFPRWKGTALARPLVDTVILNSPHSKSPASRESLLCALHRGDSFLNVDPANKARKVLGYRWNGFGFNAVNDDDVRAICSGEFDRTWP